MGPVTLRPLLDEAWGLVAIDDKAAAVEFSNRVPPDAAVVGNPDRLMLVNGGIAPGAGQIAALYERLGGLVTWIGKPHPPIYRSALALLGDPAPARVWGIGDSVEHDIAGARAAGCRTALVVTGIAAGLGDAALSTELAQHDARLDARLPAFRP